MGNRLHVASKYEVKYSSYSNFNWKSEQFHEFLNTIDIYPASNNDRFIDSAPWDFEVPKEEWRKGMDTLKSINNLTEGHQAEIREALKSLGVSLEEILQIMENYEKESDPNWGYLEFSFF